MKTLLFSIFLTISGLTTLQAQFSGDVILNLESEDQKLLNWGYYLGFNQYDFKVDYNNHDYSSAYYDAMLTSKSIGFNVGLIGELRINKYLDLRFEPGLYYNQRDILFSSSATTTSSEIVPAKSTYIHLPLLLKISTKRLGNIKPYIVGGAATSLNLSSNEGNSEGIKEGVVSMRKSNYYWEVGFGIDIYLRYFKFSPSIRGSFAFKDEIYRGKNVDSDYFIATDGTTDIFSGIYSRAIFVNFTFE